MFLERDAGGDRYGPRAAFPGVSRPERLVRRRRLEYMLSK
jgi:hypothetical protein